MRRTRAFRGPADDIAGQRTAGDLIPARNLAAFAKGARSRADDAARVARRDGLPRTADPETRKSGRNDSDPRIKGTAGRTRPQQGLARTPTTDSVREPVD